MSVPTQLGPGTRLGRYELLEQIGSGGMGQVFRATDTRLGRIVAVKVLCPSREESPHGRERFEREARAVSRLNHPHICALHDIGHDGGWDFFVMEHLEGETLARRLERGALPLTHVLKHAVEMCSALAHAHRAGLVHRDVKPSNVVLTAMGAKLLDFGIARHQGQGDGVEALQGGATLTLDGALIGTVRYMAPEQLEGLPTDSRTDVFAVGLLLYEMASGHAAFEGRSAASVIAKVLSGQPAPLHIPDLRVMRAFDSMLARCLAKGPDDRWQHIDDLKGELQWMLDTVRTDPAPARAVESAPVRGGLPVVRFFVEPPRGHTFVKFGTQIALSPDGTHLAFVASTPDAGSRLWIRPLDTPSARELPDTDGAAGPFWSPDSRQIAFFTKGTLQRIGIADRTTHVIGDVPVGTLGSGSWNGDGTIVIGSPDTGLFHLPVAGGKLAALTRVDQASHDRGYTNPQFLPDGRRFLFHLRSNDSHRAGVYLADLESPERHTLVLNTHFKAEYVEPCSLVVLRDRTLCAQPLDLAAIRAAGAPQMLAERVAFNEASGRAGFSTSHSGVLVYHAAASPRLVWFDRSGRRLGEIDISDFDADPAISPDGRFVACADVDPGTGTRGLWIYEIAMHRRRRLTDGARRNDVAPVWSPDGTRIAFASDRSGGRFDVYVKSLDTGVEELIISSVADNWPLDWSRDGAFLLFRRGADFRQLWTLPLAGGEPILLVSGTPSVAVGRVSPDGRWLAYVSGETGKEEVFLRPFPAGGPRIQVSHDGGAEPAWSADGKELIYLSRKGSFVAVPIGRSGSGAEPGPATALFHLPLVGSSSVGTLARNQYDVTADGQKFLVNLPNEDPGAIPITILVNWLAGLRAS